MAPKFALPALMLLLAGSLFADDQSRYEELLKRGQYEELEAHLNEWETRDPENPELYIGWFNYYLNLGRSSGIALEQRSDAPEGTSMALSDPETGEIVGYMFERTSYDPEMISLAISYLNRGLELAPDRLDMHFGKIHILQEIGDFGTESEALVAALETSVRIENAWYWSNYEKVDEGRRFLLNNIQDYYQAWFSDGSDAAVQAIRRAAGRQMELYPSHPYAYNNLAISYLIRNELNEALPLLLSAETLDPQDYIIINNIARVYYNLGDWENARGYFLKLREFPDEIDQGYVDRALESIDQQ
jgi:tetratricopeptide (TPR) repeat protein